MRDANHLSNRRKRLRFTPRLEWLEQRRQPAIFIVNSTADPGDGVADVSETTLREAISVANSTPGADTINFAIPGAGVQTISPTSALPIITEAVTINGYTQTGASANTLALGSDAVLRIELDGTTAGFKSNGLRITGGGCTISGLVIDRFGVNGIVLEKGDGNLITGNYIGCNPAGTAGLPNLLNGVHVQKGSTDNIIGGGLPADRNVISGNAMEGIQLKGATVQRTFIQGNYIGTTASGLGFLGNGDDGIDIESPFTTVGGNGAGAGNLISGNNDDGIDIFKPATADNLIMGNFIGTNRNGTAALGNGDNGIEITKSPRNTIGGAAAAAVNVISGNVDDGVDIFGGPASGNLIKHNFIGLDLTGTQFLGNGDDGIDISARGNTVGGTTVAERNIISGNNFNGVLINDKVSKGNVVQGNYIGTDISGTLDRGNGEDGVAMDFASSNTVGGTALGAGNLICGNLDDGIESFGSTAKRNVIQGNIIGTDPSFTLDLGNAEDGIDIDASGFNTIGGLGVGEQNFIRNSGANGIVIQQTVAKGVPKLNVILGNEISANGLAGVAVTGLKSVSNRIQRNSIFKNVGVGIDLGTVGVTANDLKDADTGPNFLQNTAVITQAASGATTQIQGTLNSKPNSTFTIDFYASAIADPSGSGEGERYLGSLEVTTDGNGDATITAAVGASIAGEFITATATDVAGNTSEFSNALAAT